MAPYQATAKRRLVQGLGRPALARAALLGLALLVAAVVHRDVDLLPGARQVESGVRDFLLAATADKSADPRIAIVDIDEESLERVGPWPWPRDTLADLVERLLSSGGASVVAFDLVLPEADRLGPGSGGDDRLASLAAQGWLVAAQAFDYVDREQRLRVGTPGGASAAAANRTTATATGYIGNFGALASGRCVGNIGVAPDPDGKIRRLPLWTRWAGADYPTLALATLACANPTADLGSIAGRIPVDRSGFWQVPFLKSPDQHLAVPAAYVLDGSFARLVQGTVPGTSHGRPLAGRSVLVGSSALGLADRVATPLSSNVSGVTVHAAALSALLDAQASKTGPLPLGRALAGWLVASTIVLWLVIALGAGLRAMVVTLAVTLPAWAALAIWAARTGTPTPVTAPLWAYGALLLIHLPIEWSWANTRVRRRTRLLSRYVAREVLDELLAAGDEDPLKPRNAEVTVLIADMEGYTRLTSETALEQAAELTRGFLDALTRPVLEHRGTLDRYTGDGMVAFWGAPVAVADHADRALDAAFAILANVERFNAERAKAGAPAVRVRIGIASGSALVGDLGTRFRIAYTAVGNCINLASRLQQLSRELDVSIAVAPSTQAMCRRWRFGSLGEVSIRGLTDLTVFTPLGPGTQQSPT